MTRASIDGVSGITGEPAIRTFTDDMLATMRAPIGAQQLKGHVLRRFGIEKVVHCRSVAGRHPAMLLNLNKP